MNQKIKEFALQSGMVDPVMGEKSYTNFCHEKFASLIIEECQNVIAEVYREMPLETCGWMLHLEEKILDRFYANEEISK